MPISKVSVVGLGYVGLPAAALLASRGVDVVGVDTNPEVVATINSGNVHIKELMLDIAVQSVVANGRLRAVLQPEPAEVFLIAVPTPLYDNRTADLSHIRAAADAIAPVLEPGNLIVLESTSPVGTTLKLSRWLGDARPDLTFPHDNGEDAEILVAYCPERVMPGNVLAELIHNDRTIGGLSRKSSERAMALYDLFLEGKCLITDARTAEMVKLSENAYRDMNLAFANELSLICDKLGINIWEMIGLANHHPRVDILRPGPGVGGHCIPVDPWFIVEAAPELSDLIRASRSVNSAMPQFVVQKVRDAAAKLKDPVITFFGLTFKADIDDLRGSPALEIVQEIAGYGGKILVVEPYIDTLPDSLDGAPGVALSSINNAIEQGDILVLLVDHREFRKISPEDRSGKVIIDTRGMWGAY